MKVIICLIIVATFSIQFRGTKLTCWDICNNNCFQMNGIITDTCLNQCNCTCDLNCKAICGKYLLGPRCELGCGCLANRPYVGPFGQEDPEESLMEIEGQMIVPMQYKTVIELENSEIQYKNRMKTQIGMQPNSPPVYLYSLQMEYRYQNPNHPMNQHQQNPLRTPQNQKMQIHAPQTQNVNTQPQLTPEDRLYFLLKACVDCIKMQQSSQYMNQLSCNVECDAYYKAKTIVENMTQTIPTSPTNAQTQPFPSTNQASPIKLAQLIPEETGFGRMAWTTFFVVFLLGIALVTGAITIFKKFKLFRELKNTYLSSEFSTSYIKQVN